MNSRQILIAMAVIYDGNWHAILRELREHHQPKEEDMILALKSIKSNVLTILDDEYPQYLKEMFMPPLVLFYYGDINLINDPKKCLGVIGTREPTDFGLKACNTIIDGFDKDIVVVSGVAKGIDAYFQNLALENKNKCIGVIGCGIDNVYPIENEELYEKLKTNGNLLISEYPNMSAPHQYHFPLRNRMIAQFSSSILVVEAKLKSGTMNTVSYSLLYGRNIFCIPSPFLGESGCNQLIHEGGILVDKVEQINDYYTEKILLSPVK